ncbi:MAG: hypothetical protein JO372_07140, partial [Solirubrobacterales bacterium]|nr:hypothetical protein [Solirubrobacterales bacterium]
MSAGQTGEWQINAPAGLAITAAAPNGSAFGTVGSGSYGWQAGGYWQGGSDIWPGNGSASATGPIFSGYYGWKLYCYASSCPGGSGGGTSALLGMNDVVLTVYEAQGPSIVAIGSNNLWYQAYRGWVWNPAGDPFSVEFEAYDPSGVCNMYASANRFISGPSSSPNPYLGFTQCPTPIDWSPSQPPQVDTAQIAPPGT